MNVKMTINPGAKGEMELTQANGRLKVDLACGTVTVTTPVAKKTPAVITYYVQPQKKKRWKR